MTTIRQIVSDAFRESGITPVGEEPEADSFDEALRRFQVILKSLFGQELGENLKSYSYGQYNFTNASAKFLDISSAVDSNFAPSNSRLVFNIDAAKTIYLPPNPNDGARFGVLDNAGNFATYNVTLNANGRQIETSATAVLNTNSLSRQWFYRADTGNWVRITDVVASDETPLPEEFNDLLIIMLAMRLNPRYGAETRPEVLDTLRRTRSQFRARYRQSEEVGVEDALLYLSSNQTYFDRTDDNTRFDKGV